MGDRDGDALVSEVRRLCGGGRWGEGIRLAMEQGGLLEADLAVELEVARSTVRRWAESATRPAASSVPSMKRMVVAMLERRQAGQDARSGSPETTGSTVH